MLSVFGAKIVVRDDGVHLYTETADIEGNIFLDEREDQTNPVIHVHCVGSSSFRSGALVVDGEG